MPPFEVIDMEALLERYGKWADFDVLENANRYPGPTGFFSYVAENMLSKIAESIIPSDFYKAHQSGLIYIHKLPYSIYIPYCTGHSVYRLLKKGLKTPTISSKPARHFDTYVDHIANYLITLQHYFTGAQAFSLVELYAGPFIRHDHLDMRQIRQNIQRLVFNLNYPSRVGFQPPFTNFTIALDAAKRLIECQPAVYAGEDIGVLASYIDEAKKFVIALSEVLLEGDAYGLPFTFPIVTLMTTAKSIWEDPELFEAVFKTAAKRGSFYWLNTRVVDPDSAFAMCCRLTIRRDEITFTRVKFGLKDLEQVREERLKELERVRQGGIWALPDVTGSINVTAINLPRLALMAMREESRFWELYEGVLGLARAVENWFRARYMALIGKYPHMYSLILEYLWEFPNTHFNTIGLIGLPEATAILMQEPRLWREGSHRDWIRAVDLMRKIVEFAVEHVRKWMIEEGVPWNVEEVPGESAAAKLAAKDLAEYPELAEYLPDSEYPIYSTSIAPYYGVLDLVDRIEIESKVQRLFTGGVMMHIFIGEEPDPEALASLTKRLMETDLVYWSYTPAITHCEKCKSTFTGLYTTCPKCGSDQVEVWSRIVGYYRPLRNWNPARKREFWRRVHYRV